MPEDVLTPNDRCELRWIEFCERCQDRSVLSTGEEYRRGEEKVKEEVEMVLLVIIN